MYFPKPTVLIAVLWASQVFAAPSPDKTNQDFQRLSELRADVESAIQELSSHGDDSSFVTPVVTRFLDLVNGLAEMNQANGSANEADFSTDDQNALCERLKRTRFSQAKMISLLGNKNKAITGFGFGPATGRTVEVYDRDIKYFLDEVDSRLNDCGDDYKERLESSIQTAKSKYPTDGQA
ncbi:hypothetical protein FDECE_1770 [Fusarium decemcellulare]|nr:hypothetical protein FDECE_1770 [Fusarium decemcellulare]